MQKEMCYLNKPEKERKWKNYEGGPQLPGVSSCGGRRLQRPQGTRDTWCICLGGEGDQSRLSVSLAKNSDHAQCVTMRDPHSIWGGRALQSPSSPPSWG